MKTLLNFILESEDIISLKDKIVNYIKDNEDIPLDNLKRAYNVLQNISKETYDKLNIIYKGNKEGLQYLIQILEKTGQKSEFLTALIDKENFPTFNDLVSNNNLFDLVKEQKFKFNEIFNNESQLNDFLKMLIEKSYKVAGKGVGCGELFLTTLFKNTSHPNKGDVKIDDEEIEVKFSSSFSDNGGRLIPAKSTLKTVDEMATYLEQALKDKGIDNFDNIDINANKKIIIAGQKYINNIFSTFENKIDKKDIFNILAKMYFYQFNNLSDKEDEFDKFISKITNYSFDNLIKIHGCLALISYQLSDNWSWLLVGVTKTSDYCMINAKDCSYDNFAKSMEDLMKRNDFTFKKYPSNTNGAHPMQDRVCQIYVTKK